MNTYEPSSDVRSKDHEKAVNSRTQLASKQHDPFVSKPRSQPHSKLVDQRMNIKKNRSIAGKLLYSEETPTARMYSPPPEKIPKTTVIISV
jgi:hypothetical protein